MCNVCHENPCHPSCPNYEADGNLLVCEKCKQPIFPDNFYAETIDGYVHYECISQLTTEELINMFDISVKLM